MFHNQRRTDNQLLFFQLRNVAKVLVIVFPFPVEDDVAIVIRSRQSSVHSVGFLNGPPLFDLDLALKPLRSQM